jgi:hypothetical protein
LEIEAVWHSDAALRATCACRASTTNGEVKEMFGWGFRVRIGMLSATAIRLAFWRLLGGIVRSRFVMMAAVAMAVTLALTDCARIVGQLDAQNAVKNAKSCAQEVWATAEGQLLSARIWLDNEMDTASKLSDPNPLTKEEQDALVVVHNRLQPCKQIILTHDNKFAAWETPYWQQYFQRSDEIFYKLASGEIPVGLANRLSIESKGKFQTDVSRGHAQAVAVDEARQQRASEAMLQAGTQIYAASQNQNRVTTTNCSWMGNMLNCTSVR